MAGRESSWGLQGHGEAGLWQAGVVIPVPQPDEMRVPIPPDTLPPGMGLEEEREEERDEEREPPHGPH